MSINHEKYTLFIVDEYLRYTWVHFLKKKSQAPEMIMSFIRMVENHNNVTFQTNNVIGNFNYPSNVPAYHPIRKFLMNCPLKLAFTKSLSVLYQNLLREFWSTSIAYDPNPPTHDSVDRALREFLIKFSVMNDQPFTLDFSTFCYSTGLDYKKGKYVAHPTPETVKTTLGKIATNASYLDKTPILKNSFPVAWRILFTFVIQVLGGNYSSTKQINSIQQMIAYCYITGTEVDIEEIIYSDLVTKLGPFKFTEIELMAHMIVVNNQKDSVSPPPLSGKKKKVKSQTVTPILPKSQGPEASDSLPQKRKNPKSKKPPTKTKETPPPSQQRVLNDPTQSPQAPGNIQPTNKGLPSTASNKGTDKTTPSLEEPLGDKDSEGNIPPADMKPINPTVADPLGTGAEYQDKEAADSYADLRASVEGYYKENDAVKDDPALNKKVIEATEAYTNNSSALTKLLNLSTNSLAWNLGPKMTAVEISQADIRSNISSLKQDTSDIKSMMIEIYQAFKGQASTSSSSVPQTTLAITERPINIRGENDTQADTEEPSSHTEGKHVAIEDDKAEEEPTRAEHIKKAAEEAKIFEMTRNEVIKVVQEKAEKIGLDHKKIISAKAGEKFKKAQDAEHKVLKRQHTKKSALPTPILEQASSQSLGRKRKHLELEPEIKVPRSLSEQSLNELPQDAQHESIRKTLAVNEAVLSE
ncbi:hypothetical protein Tco_0240635 [Tanacetum coccineum]